MIEVWREKAHSLIYKECTQSWRETNIKKNGRRYKKPRPYTVPPMSRDLVQCLGDNDEERAKAIFLSYVGTKVARIKI